ncbi:MAG TPA: cystathionine beta-lyase [Clostridiales bacterium]|nr:cystathionine beta-lyase [Clostridiales bacterium]
MRYDFDKVIDRRGTGSAKWDLNEELFGTDDVLDMWVADMDFPCPQPVIDALRRRLEHPIFGYGFPPDSLYRAVMDRMDRFFGWKVEKEWITFTPGVVSALHAAVRAVAEVGDEIVIQPPVYYPFFRAVADSGCQLVHNQLRLEESRARTRREPGTEGTWTLNRGRPQTGPADRPGPVRYVMDYDDLEEHFRTAPGFPGKSHRIRGLILCSPHNPVGRVWSREELERLAEICLRNDCVIISDEIHCDLLLGGSRHVPTATLSPEVEARTITLMAPSKSFNLAGLSASFAIIPDAGLRRRFERARTGQGGVNVLGLVAMEAALREGDEYLSQLNAYLTRNMRFFAGTLKDIPGVRLVPPEGPEGTYLAWVDMSGLAHERGMVRPEKAGRQGRAGPTDPGGTGPGSAVDDEALRRFMLHEARIATDPGYVFGPGGEGFHRFNLACPRSVVEEAVARLERAVRAG